MAPEFPQLSEEEIREITLGTYQVEIAKSILMFHEHINENGNYEIHVNEYVENVVSARIQSCHVSAKKYYCWIQYREGVVQAWYCKFKAGSHEVGCCAHITCSVVMYLAYARH